MFSVLISIGYGYNDYVCFQLESKQFKKKKITKIIVNKIK